MLQDLIGELSTRSERFRRRWAAHDVRYHRTGTKRLHHPLVGDLDLLASWSARVPVREETPRSS